MIYLRLLWEFLQIGLFTIGGGYAMIPLISQKVVGNGWMSREMLVDFIAISESTPGPFAINIATFVGAQVGGGGFGGFLGAAAATFGVIFPSFVIIYIIARFLNSKVVEKRPVQDVLYGMRPAVTGLITSVFISLTLSTVFSAQSVYGLSFKNTDFAALIIFVIILGLSFIKKPKKIHPALLIAVSAGLGILIYGVIMPAAGF